MLFDVGESQKRATDPFLTYTIPSIRVRSRQKGLLPPCVKRGQRLEFWKSSFFFYYFQQQMIIKQTFKTPYLLGLNFKINRAHDFVDEAKIIYENVEVLRGTLG